MIGKNHPRNLNKVTSKMIMSKPTFMKINIIIKRLSMDRFTFLKRLSMNSKTLSMFFFHVFKTFVHEWHEHPDISFSWPSYFLASRVTRKRSRKNKLAYPDLFLVHVKAILIMALL